MYLYFDKTGVLKEVINDRALRQSDSNDYIYIYVEDLDFDDIETFTFQYRNNGGLLPIVPNTYLTTDAIKVPYNPRRDLKYFNYFDSYKFIKIPTSFEYQDEQYSALAVPGNVSLTVRINDEVLGLIVFNVEETTDGNHINPDQYLNLAQFYYLLSKIKEYENEVGVISLNAAVPDGTDESENPYWNLTDEMLKALEYEFTVIHYLYVRGSISDYTFIEIRKESSSRPRRNLRYFINYNIQPSENMDVDLVGKILEVNLVQGTITLIKDFESYILSDESVDTLLRLKQNVLTPGAGISITGDVISANVGISVEIVSVLPATGNTNTIYLVSISGSSSYSQWMYVNDEWVQIGSTEIDLSEYAKKSASLPYLSFSGSTTLSTVYASSQDKPFILIETTSNKRYLCTLIQAAVGTNMSFKFIPLEGTATGFYAGSGSNGLTLTQCIDSLYFRDTDLSGYATKTWVENQGYLTDVPSYINATSVSSEYLKLDKGSRSYNFTDQDMTAGQEVYALRIVEEVSGTLFRYWQFPNKSGTVALLDDITTGSKIYYGTNYIGNVWYVTHSLTDGSLNPPKVGDWVVFDNGYFARVAEYNPNVSNEFRVDEVKVFNNSMKLYYANTTISSLYSEYRSNRLFAFYYTAAGVGIFTDTPAYIMRIFYNVANDNYSCDIIKMGSNEKYRAEAIAGTTNLSTIFSTYKVKSGFYRHILKFSLTNGDYLLFEVIDNDSSNISSSGSRLNNNNKTWVGMSARLKGLRFRGYRGGSFDSIFAYISAPLIQYPNGPDNGIQINLNPNESNTFNNPGFTQTVEEI